MASLQEVPDRVRNLIHRWFVLYNPLYFFSALCVLTGVFLVGRSLHEGGGSGASPFLDAAVQSYEFLVIGAAALLFRRAGTRRAAVILGLLSLPFLFDVTLRTESFVHAEPWGRLTALVWTALVPMKLLLLGRAFHLRLDGRDLLVPLLAAAGVACGPHLIALSPMTVHLVATWFGAVLVCVSRRTARALRSEEELDRWGRTVLRRASTAARWIGLCLFFAHVAAWSVQFHVVPTLSHATPFAVLLVAWRRQELLVWGAAAAAIGLAVFDPPTLAPTAAVTALVLAFRSREKSLRRLAVAAVLALHVAIWTFGWEGGAMPEPLLALGAGTAGVLMMFAWMLRLRTALPAAAVVLWPAARILAPSTALEWGLASLAAGFAALLLGVAVNWRLSGVRREITEPEP